MQVFKLGTSQRTLLPRKLPTTSSFILSGPKGTGKSSMLYQYLAEQQKIGRSVVYLDAKPLFMGRLAYHFKDGYYLRMKNLKNKNTIIGIDNINAFLEYTNYTDTKNKTLHAMNFQSIINILKMPNLVGAESTVFKYPTNKKQIVDFDLYDRIPKVLVQPLTKLELSHIAPEANLNRLLMLTGGVMKQIKRVAPYEQTNKFL